MYVVVFVLLRTQLQQRPQMTYFFTAVSRLAVETPLGALASRRELRCRLAAKRAKRVAGEGERVEKVRSTKASHPTYSEVSAGGT